MSSRTRDYADRHPRNKPRRQAARAGARKAGARPGGGVGLPAWAWMVLGLSAGLLVAAFVYISRPAAPMDMAPSTAKAAPAAIELPPKEPSRFTFYEMLPSYEVVVSDEVLNAPPPKPPPKPQAAPVPTPTTVTAADRAEQPAVPAAATSSGPRASPGERVAAVQAAIAAEERERAARAAPAPTPSAATAERWLIQVAAYRSRDDAEQQRAALALAGLAARIEQVTIDDSQTWFRVRVGPYDNAAAAQAAQRSLQAQGLKGVVMKIRS